MTDFPIVSKNQQQAALGTHMRLPEFYMEDFSILGLCVDSCDRAVALLKHHQFVVSQTNGSTVVAIDEPAQVAKVVGLLKENGLDCELSDVAQGMYQG